MATASGPVSVSREAFGTTQAGEAVTRITLDAGDIKAKIITYGGILQELWTPDAAGGLGDVVLGFDELEPYLENNPFFGCLVGRHSGRLKSPFTIDGVEYSVAGSDGGGGGIDEATNLHGGKVGWDKKNWKVSETACDSNSAWVTLSYMSPDGEEGFPGTVDVNVTYKVSSVNGNQDLSIDYSATTDKTTIVSMTNHTYFNLSDVNPSIRAHTLVLNGDGYAAGPASGTGVPTGEIAPVKGTVMDFTPAGNPTPRELGPAIDAIAKATPLWPHGEGFVVAGNEGKDSNVVAAGGKAGLALMATLYDPQSGRTMECRTSEPQMQTYYATFLDSTLPGKAHMRDGATYPQHGAICLEAERFSNAVNIPAFPSQLCTQGNPYRQLTIYSFPPISR